jgi:hypothetical protein
VAVRASVARDAHSLLFKFQLDDPEKLVQDGLVPAKHTQFQRTDELWRTTCFEAFWGEPGSSAYYELNLSPLAAQWNVYAFDGYRSPQPPRSSNDFELESLNAGAGTLEAKLISRKKLRSLEVSLTAVIRLKDETHYFAAHHAAAKPDFHARKSFIILA